MKNINFLRITLFIVATWLSFSHNIFFVHGYAPSWRNLTGRNSISACGSNCCGNVSGAKQCDEKSAADKEKCNGLDNKEKVEKGYVEKAEDFCRLKDLY